MADSDFGPNFLEYFRDDFVSVCTIQSIPTTASPGGPVRGTPVNVAGMVNIPCRKMPEYGTSVRGLQENVSSNLTLTTGTFLVDLMGYYPGITAEMQAVVDGEAFNVLGQQSDGSKVSTTLRVETLNNS